MTERESRPSMPPGWSVDETADARCHAIAALPPQAIEDHLDALIDLLRDRNWRVRREAALAVARVRDPSTAVRSLLAEVCSDDVLARNAALEALRNMGSAVVDPVLACLATAVGPARRFLVEALLEGADVRCVPTLRALLDDPDGNVPPAATEVLGVIEGPEALDALGDALERRDPVVRLAALIAFEARREVARWQTVSALVDDPVCGAHAVRALATQRDAASIARVAEALASPHRRVALAALTACARVARSDDGRVAWLAEALSSSKVLFALASRAELGTVAERVAAIESLALAGDPSTLEVVLRGCASRDPEVATAAEAALDGYPAESIPAALERGLRGTPHVAAAVMAWALRCGRDDDAAALTALAWTSLENASGPVTAWEVVARFGGPDDARLLAERVGRSLSRSDTDIGELLPAIDRALRLHRAEVEPLLRSFVAPTRAGMLVALALVRAGLSLDRAQVAEGLDAADPLVRAAALRALGVAGEGPDGDAIDRARRDPSPEVHAALVDAVRLGRAQRETLTALVFDRSAEPPLRAAALASLAARGSHDATLIDAAFSDPDGEVVLEGIRVFDVDAPIAALVGATSHTDNAVVIEALARLRERDAQAATGRAAVLLTHASPQVRVAAVRALSGRSSSMRTVLTDRLKRETDVDVRNAIDDALLDPS